MEQKLHLAPTYGIARQMTRICRRIAMNLLKLKAPLHLQLYFNE